MLDELLIIWLMIFKQKSRCNADLDCEFLSWMVDLFIKGFDYHLQFAVICLSTIL